MASTGTSILIFKYRGLKIGFIGFNIAEHTATLFSNYKDVKFSTTTLSTIGLAIAQSLAPGISDKTANKILKVRSLTTSQSEILSAFQQVTATNWTVNEADLDANVAQSEEKLKNGDFSGAGALIIGAALDERTANDWDRIQEVANPLLQIPDEDLITIIKTLV
jgi:hypothetical protein